MLYKNALPLAQQLLELLHPECQRIEIAGSVRRQKPDVGDIELVAIPKMVPSGDLFGTPVSALSGYDFTRLGKVLKHGQRYVQIALHQQINLDLFLVLPPATWGVIFTLRTGPDTFSRSCVTPRSKRGLLPSYLQVKDGAVRHASTGEVIPTPEEKDFFRVLEMQWIPPDKRR